MNFSRKMIFVVGAALLAACGDKVTVVDPPTQVIPPPKINSVEVAPLTATLTVNQTITMTAAVNADAGLATTVTWSSSDASKASVSTAGVVTAVAATPGVAICAASTVDTGKKGCASIVVQAAAAAIPASISINSIQITGALGGATVNPAAVAGNIDIILNYTSGNQTVSKIVLLVGGIRTDSMVLTAAQAAALRFASDEAIAAQTASPQIIFQVNTANYSATGVPTWLNGSRGVSAQLYTTQGGSASAATATAQTNLTFANVDGFAVTTSGGTSLVDALGYRWTGNGSLTVNAIPVMYSGSVVGTVNAVLGANVGCAAVGAVGSATTLTAGAYVITGTMTASQSGAGCTTTSPNLIVITATNSAGDNLTLAGATGVLNTQTGLRWDNVAPALPAITANVNGRSGGWLNDAVNFAAVNLGTTATANNWVTAAVADAGIGGGIAGTGITYGARVGATTGLVDAARTAAILSDASSLAVTNTGAAYCAIAVAQDALGNVTAVPAAAAACGGTTQSTAIGVDRAAPTAGFSTSGAAGNMVANAGLTVLTQVRVIATDTGLSGNSGFIGGASVAGISGSISRRTAATTSGTAVTVGVGAASNTVINLARVDGSGLLVADTLVYDFSAITTNAYYTLTTSVVDQAGNAAGALSRTFLMDNTLPTALAPVQNLVSPTAGGALTFNSTIADNLDISTGSLAITFPNTSFSGVLNVAGAVVAPGVGSFSILAFGPSTFNTYNVAPAVISGALAATIPALYALQGHTDSTTIVASNSYPTAINAVVSDMANVAVVSGAGTLQNPPAAPALYAIGTEYQKFLLSRSSTTVNVAGSATVGAVTSRNITPRVEGTTLQAAPFTTVDLYVLGLGQTSYTFLGTSSLTGQTDNGGQRIWTFSAVAFAPSATYPAGVATIVGIAKGASGKYVMGQGTQLTVAP